MLRFFRNVGLGALIAYFFDPDNGRSRRTVAHGRIRSVLRRDSAQGAQAVPSEATTAMENVGHSTKAETRQPDDVTLARKVETEIFSGAEVSKGQINVNAENGKVVLRGEVEKPSMIKDLEKKTRKVQGVQDVENLLHTPAGKS